MFPSPKRTRTTPAYNLRPAAFPARRFIAQVLAFLLLAQMIAPPAIAAPAHGFSLASLASHASSLTAVLGNLGSGVRATSARTVAVIPAAEDFGVVLTPLTTAFAGHAGIEHHQPLRKVVVSSNNPTGVPFNFESLDADGTHRPYSNVAGLLGGLKIATARDDGTGMSRGGFSPGELFSGTGTPGVIARVAPDGASVQNPWVTLSGEGGQLSGGLFVDRIGTFGGDLIAVTTAGGVWRINSAGVAARVADLGTHLEGVTTLSDDATKYGPWAGKILVGAKDQRALYAIDAQGNTTSYQLGVSPGDIRVIPAHENFYGVDPASGTIWGVPDDAFAGMIGDILIAQGSPGVLARVRWNGSEFEVGQIALVSSWEQVTFSPAALSEIGGVKQVYDKIAVVRHAPELNSGRVEGALWQLLPENVELNGTDVITSDLLVPGTPTVTLGSGHPNFDGIIEGVESAQPTGYSISISNNASLRHVITRTNPISLAPVPLPPAPAGTRDVSLSKANQTIGDPATLRHLSISGKASAVVIPPGTYGRFSASGHTAFVLGVEGATVPSVYNLEGLSLSGGSELRLAGPVKLTVKGNVSLAGSSVGAADDPHRLLLQVVQGSVGVTGNGVLYGIVRNPEGMVSIGGNGRIRGTVTCDRLNIHGNGVLQITESDVAPPASNRPPAVDAGPDQTITLPTDVVNLNGTATDDGRPLGSPLVTIWTKVSGPGTVAFSALDNAVATATFADPGVYVLRLSANDSQLTTFDEMTVEVVPRNQPPEVNAGSGQAIELPNGATLNGTVSDDALPRGETLKKTWVFVSGTGTATFADPHDLATPVTFTTSGTYVLRLTADDTEFSVSDEVVITVYPENQPPVVNAGPDQTLRLPNSATLNGAVTDDGLPPDSALTTKWTKVSGPGTVTFADSASPVTTAQFAIEGTYVLRLSADDTRLAVSDECTVTVLPRNAPPVVNAGLDQEITFLEAITLDGTANDDGMPVGSILEVTWAKVSGPGAVIFTDPANPITSAAFSTPGTYVLRLTGDDTQVSAFDEATVVVMPRAHASRVYTLDSDFNEGDFINLTHSTPDQLQFDPMTTTNTGAWSVVFDSQITGAEWGRIGWTAQVCGDGLLTVSVAASEDNAAYTQPLVVSNGDDPALPNGRFIKITVSFERASSGESPVLYDLSIGTVGFPIDTPLNVAPGVDAGTDQTLDDTTTAALRASVCDDALPSNQRLSMIWSQVNGPGTATFANLNSPVTDVTFSAPGTYMLRINATDSMHTGGDVLVVTVIPGNQSPVVNAGTDQTVVLPASASLSGTVTDDGLPSGGTLTATWSKLSGPGVVTFGNVNHPATTASFSEAGTYVLRLEASDSRKNAFDELTVSVLPRLNSPPNITSEPATELSLGPAPIGAGELVNLAPWTVKQYELNSQPSANWFKDLVNNRATQTVNADASFLLSDFDLARTQMDGTWRVDTTSDDDFIGFVFGYQNSEHFYLFDWKKGSQNDTVGFAERGMSVKVFNAGSTLTSRDFWPTAGNGTRVRTLYHNTVPWQTAIDYQFTLQFYPGEIKIIVRQGTTILADITVNDATYTNGRFGFYNYSQAQVKYSGFRRLALTQGTYSYDVEASDPDGDAVTYSLTAAPSGMSIDPATGLINWPVTSRDAGDHNITVRAQDPQGAFDTQSYTLSILNQNKAPLVNAGSDLVIAINGTASLSGAVTDDGLPRNAVVTPSWSMVSGPGLVAFTDSASSATTATFSEAGVYVLRLSATDTALNASDETVITVTPPNQAPVVNASSDLIITQPGTARLNGTASDDGLPHGSALAVSWSKVSGPGSVAFTDAARAATLATFSEPGSYVLRLSANDTELTSADDVSVTVNPPMPNQAPVVLTGANQTVALNANLIANAGNDEQLASGKIRAWTEAVGNLWTRGMSGAGGFPESINGDSFFYAGGADSAELRQDVDVSAFAASIATGTQSFEWKASVRSRAESVPDSARLIVEYRNQSNTAAIAWVDSGEVSSVDTWRLLENTRTAPAGTGWIRLRLIATRRTGTTNDAYFDALSLRGVTGVGVKLSGTVTDDSLPASGTLTTTWSKVSGPGTVTFASVSTAQSSATFSEAGVYVLRLSASDSELTSGDELTVTVEPRNLAPTVEAGANQTVTLPVTVSLNGTVNDDGRPAGTAVTSRWSKVSGLGAVTFADANALVTTAAFDAAGTYVLRLTASDAEYSGGDTITIHVNPEPSNFAPTVNAGADQVINQPATSATLSGTVNDDGRPPGGSLIYRWTKLSGPGTVSFNNSAALVTGATFGEAGVYVLRLTANDTELTGSDDVRITVAGTNKAPEVNVGADQTVAYPKAITLSGTVTDDGLPIDSALSFSWSKVSGPGTVTFVNARALQTVATFSAPGVYVLRLMASDTELSATDEVTVTQTPPPTVGISSPVDGATLTGRTNFIGTVSEGSTWRLEHSHNDEGSAPVWTTFASGSAPVINGLLGTFDPTVLLNGIYTVRLIATNAAGQTTTRSLTLVANGGQKVGNFRISFTDLSVPLAGIPIEVVRTYDSRDKRAGDFGVGWTLDVRNMRLQESVDVGAGWEATVTDGFLPSYCIQPTRTHAVTITLPNNEVLRFEAVLGPQCSLLFPLTETTISYRALPGTHATLAPIGGATVLVNASFPGDAELLDYTTFDEKDFDLYRLTLPSGAVLIIDQRAGLREATDANGNKLTISSNGITHSTGKSIAFARDAQGRITQVTDATGSALTYSYDARGDLASLRDREGVETTFAYNSNHDLLSIKDSSGRQPIRNEYDASGRLVRQIDALGKVINYTRDLDTRQEVTTDRLGQMTVREYNARGQIVRVTDAAGGVTTYAYDSRDNLTRETNSEGQTLTYTYDARDNMLSETDALGHTTRYTYNAKRQLLTETDALGRVTTNTYDARGNLTSVKDALGHTTTTTYDQRGLPLATTDALGHTTRLEYDASGNLTKRTDALGNSLTYTYDANGKQLSMTSTRTVGVVVEATTSTFEYDPEGRQTRVTFPNGAAAETAYNSFGHVSANVDLLGLRTTYGYDELGRLISITYPDGKTERYELDPEGRRLKTTDRAGRSTLNQYDALGRLVRTISSDGATHSTTYNTLGQPVAETDALGHTIRIEYNAAGQRIKVTDAGSGVMTFAYDAVGNEVSMTDPKGQVTRFEYDALDRRTRIIYPDGTSTTIAYDAQHRVSSSTDQAGRTTRFEYDNLSRISKVTDAAGGVTTYAYDERGDLVAQTDANNHTTTFEYDRLGLRVKRTLPQGMSETYGYNIAGELTTRTDFRGKTTTFAYDVMSRLVSKTPDASLGEPTVTFTYTDAGRRATMTDSSGTATYAYDVHDRLTSKQSPQGTLLYTYDAAGHLLTLRSSNAGGVSTVFDYDTEGRLSAVTDKRQPQSTGTTTYAYDANGNLSATLYPNGVQTSYTYNSLNRLTKVEAAKGTTLASYAYTLGASGNRLSVAEHTGRAVSYTYDALYRLTGETITNAAADSGSINYTYDAVGNRMSRTSTSPAIASTTYAYDANDRLNTEAYDANGNPVSSGATAYAYDFENRLTGVGGGAVSYVYDGDGNRVAKTVGGVTTRYLVDTNNLTGYAQVVEELQGGAVTRQYTYGHDLISQRQLVSGQWQTSFYGYDGHGSVRQLTDEAGVVTDTFDYDAFGALVARTGATPNEYLFTGERFDPETGFYYLRARHMNPSTGRFQTMDGYEGRAREPLSLHKYLYAHADPVNNLDPTGNFTLSDLQSAGSITNTIRKINRTIHNFVKLLDKTQKIADIFEFIHMTANILDAFKASSPSQFRQLFETELRRAFGTDVSAVTDGLQEVLDTIGPNWEDISRSIHRKAPQIGQEVWEAFKGHLDTLVKNSAAAGRNVKRIFYAPSPPGGHRKSHQDSYLEIGKSDLLVAVSERGGGRLFGVGFRQSKTMYHQIFRIDYYDRRLNPPLNVHYHILDDGESHPAGREPIWKP